MEGNFNLQSVRDKAESLRLAKRRAYMAQARLDIKEDFLSGGNQTKSNFLQQQDPDERVPVYAEIRQTEKFQWKDDV